MSLLLSAGEPEEPPDGPRHELLRETAAYLKLAALAGAVLALAAILGFCIGN